VLEALLSLPRLVTRDGLRVRRLAVQEGETSREGEFGVDWQRSRSSARLPTRRITPDQRQILVSSQRGTQRSTPSRLFREIKGSGERFAGQANG
jgi:hypothetical protein